MARTSETCRDVTRSSVKAGAFSPKVTHLVPCSRGSCSRGSSHTRQHCPSRIVISFIKNSEERSFFHPDLVCHSRLPSFQVDFLLGPCHSPGTLFAVGSPTKFWPAGMVLDPTVGKFQFTFPGHGSDPMRISQWKWIPKKEVVTASRIFFQPRNLKFLSVLLTHDQFVMQVCDYNRLCVDGWYHYST